MLHSCESSAWPPMVSSLRYSLSRLYDNNDTSTDAQLDLSTLLLDDATSDNVHLLATSFENDIELLKSNYTKVLETVERLILMDRFDDASRFTYKPIIKHIASIDHAPLIQMMIRLCSFLANTTERRDQLCSNILYHNTYALLSVKANKKLSSLFSDLILAMLEMYTMDTPGYAAKLLTKSEFYPWAELTYHIGHLIRICGSYDSFVHTDYFSKLDPLQDILKLISDRAKINPIIYRATHKPVLKYILRWSVKNTVYSMHVYKMGGQILDLIDKQQATFDTCSQFIDTLRHRVSGDEDNDDPEQARLRNAQFFQPLSARLAKFMEQFKTLPSALHQKLALFFMAILNRPLYAENGIRKFEYWTMNNIWHYVSLCIANQEDVRLYNTCLDRLYTRAQDDNDQDLKCWWISFWQTVGMKFPQVAADHVEQFLCITIDEKDMSFLVLLPITNIRTCVNEVDTRLIDVAEQVQVHIHEIERIDAKTLSYVPEWGAGVSKLLNSPASNNWCLLGKRFGYSTSELRHWATKADPCMTLLNEWYMTHETDETTYGLVKMLEDIGRHDAEKIIREAVIAAGKVIPEELDIEMKRLPPVFLSYQWGIQAAVTTLKSHLEQAGYACWMDTGQMGGGDKLFAKIDAGIRGAKIVICCMAAAYAQSVNCSREIHPCVSTGKPIIPLQMEKQPWPPEGALGPIMSEYLFIRFFDRKNAGTVNYWPEEKFAELLGQIRYHVAPDTDMISSQYNNWFVAQIDNLIFLQLSKSKNDKKVENKESTSLIDTPLEVSHPQLMISYQWDHQSYIVALYKRLTLLGYRVWLDIFQMGGGDSLFEKIDTGIRHSLCVIACVTPKYTVSINCRREMALADALSIPIIPLLLQETSTWPPPGPMALVFAEKPYINFSSKNEQSNNDNTWIGKEFQELLSRLRKFVPDVQLQTAQRNLPGMERPISAAQTGGHSVQQQPKRITSAPAIDKSQTCSLI
ncbi:unnamed protein product [Rotaria socialis]|uniref:TIR domain-containing protein n=1 Tax=Rotaria socialis TaxID=392032 RepID=A0A817M9E7_9BILA|nr:unnamed protein product [Rotaria socialis]